MFYPDQGLSGSKAFARNTGCNAGIQPGGDASPSQGTTHTHEHTRAHTQQCTYQEVDLDSGRKLRRAREHGENPEQTITGVEDQTLDPGATKWQYYSLNLE